MAFLSINDILFLFYSLGMLTVQILCY